MRVTILSAALAGSLFLGASTPASAAGVLVASGDEWQLSSFAFEGDYAAGTNGFVAALAATFGGSNYLFLNGNPGLSGQLGAAAAQFALHGKTVSYSASFNLATAQNYDAVFHFGQIIDHAALIDYVNGGGDAYVSLGSGQYGSPAGEAAAWNPTLAQFGLVAGSTWFTDAGFVKATVTSGPAGATSLLWGFGQSIDKLTPNASSQSYIRGSFANGLTDIGLVGASAPLAAGVPEPGAWTLMILGFGAVGAMVRRSRRTAAC
ncbi:MAG: PEPxxWA-CTERM sorting domain-containing protein [Phenylobacterium sp.]|uniref:PEPxxWA-CTERM sorting domain-containing protein n=1 Tax=Phenylobacterium sp. TaxID=1871053 RepID=UPI001A623CDF|nr:PEPxxWA-CTERM sorting domain-containing protein [Phenylobacterium sp.]MBL8555318.1 PEPxxWA-CTERM sorting domain-containing protein [Phenylobacterium sp.]